MCACINLSSSVSIPLAIHEIPQGICKDPDLIIHQGLRAAIVFSWPQPIPYHFGSIVLDRFSDGFRFEKVISFVEMDFLKKSICDIFKPLSVLFFTYSIYIAIRLTFLWL